MTFRSNSDLIFAANQSRDLANLVQAYMILWRKHANGKNKVSVPTDDFTVVFLPPTETAVVFRIVYTYTNTWSEPQYYDVDSDYFSESWGADNVSHHITRRETKIGEKGYEIPFACLLRSKEDMEASIKRTAESIKKREQEDERQREIAELESQLAKLKTKESP